MGLFAEAFFQMLDKKLVHGKIIKVAGERFNNKLFCPSNIPVFDSPEGEFRDDLESKETLTVLVLAGLSEKGL